MAKDTYYFSHDYNARNDSKIKKLLAKHGYLGYGLFWAIVEDLYNNANALPLEYESIAFDLRTNENIVESIINDFDLFCIDKSEFGSTSIERRLNERDEKSKKARESAFKRWNKEKNNANALPTQSECNAIKEKKGKEIKENDYGNYFVVNGKIEKGNVVDWYLQNHQPNYEALLMQLSLSSHDAEIKNELRKYFINGFSFNDYKHIANSFKKHIIEHQKELLPKKPKMVY